MRFSKILAVSVIMLLMAAGAAQVRADSEGDDLVVCCDVIPPAPRVAAAAGPICGAVQSCVPIDGSTASINRCKGIVMGCAESAFLCTPSSVTKGKQDCACASLEPMLCPRTE